MRMQGINIHLSIERKDISLFLPIGHREKSVLRKNVVMVPKYVYCGEYRSNENYVTK